MKDKIYGLKSDLLFKNVFGKEKYLKQFFKDIFHEDIKEFVYSDKETFKENRNLSYSICDLLLETENEYIIFELQNQDLKNIESRIAMYFVRIYSKQKINRHYDNVKPVKIRLILNYPYGKEASLKEYYEFEERIKEKFGSFFEIKIWNIREALKEVGTIGYDYAFLFVLAEISKEKSERILSRLKMKKRFKELAGEIEMYNADLEVYLKLKESEMKQMTLEDVAHNYKLEGISIGERRGEKRGIMTGKLETAIRLLGKGIAMTLVIEATGLKEEQILEYQSNCVKN